MFFGGFRVRNLYFEVLWMLLEIKIELFRGIGFRIWEFILEMIRVRDIKNNNRVDGQCGWIGVCLEDNVCI